jgi:hypothetical protein
VHEHRALFEIGEEKKKKPKLLYRENLFGAPQEFSYRKPTVTSSTSAARLALHSSKAGLVCLSVRMQIYVLLLI